MKNTSKTFILSLTTILIMIGIAVAFEASAQTQPKESKWVETAQIEIPYDAEIISGITKNGNPKYTLVVEDINVSISPSNYEKFKNKKVVLLLVEWKHTETGKYKYTTRQKSTPKENKKLDFNNLW